MTLTTTSKIDPKLDLVLERVVDVPPELVWKAWTTPEHIKKWFAPAPWTVTECRIDLRPGGEFATTMKSPEGVEMPGSGCYLEVVENKRLVWTDALKPGYRPSEKPFFTCVLTFESHGKGTKFTAVAIHKDEETKTNHENMGFHTGWGQCLDQLVELVKKELQ